MNVFCNLGLCLALAAAGCAGAAPAGRPAVNHERIVFLGDSITDGFTYPLLVRQALAEAGRPVPVLINAGIGGDTAEGMLARLERDVLAHRPTLVSMSVGVNDVLRGVTAPQYEARVTTIAARMRAAGVPMLVMTTTVLGPTHAEADARLAAYNGALRRLAARHGRRVAEVNRLMARAREAGEHLLEADDVHINFAGYRVIARAVLDALGYPDVPVPARQKVEVEPGIIRAWRVRAAPDGSPPLDAARAAALAPDDTWHALTLPEPQPIAHWWQDQERRRGFAMSVDRLAGPAKTYQAVAVIDSPAARRVVLRPGADLRTIWLGGACIYRNDGLRGWHPGRETVTADLKAGPNGVAIETGPQFFLSVAPE